MPRPDRSTTSKWYHFKKFINSFVPGTIITRKQIIKEFGELTLIETYRLYLTRAGYLPHVGVGQYQLVNRPHLSLTLKKCTQQGYGIKSWTR